jgi:hypothetical protein
MKRTTIGASARLGAGLVFFVALVTFAPAAAAGDFGTEGFATDCDMRFKFGASGQPYIWRSGGC